MSWLAASELRIGLGCMRLSTDESRDEETALATIAAAAEAGMTVFDTAHAYGPVRRARPQRAAARPRASPLRCRGDARGS